MANDFKVVARLLAACKASEESPVFDVALIDEQVLKTTFVIRFRSTGQTA